MAVISQWDLAKGYYCRESWLKHSVRWKLPFPHSGLHILFFWFIFLHWICSISYLQYSLSYEEKVVQACLTLWDPTNCSLPGSSVYGILQARMLEWVAIPFSRGFSWPRNWTWVSCIAGNFFTIWATSEASNVVYLILNKIYSIYFNFLFYHLASPIRMYILWVLWFLSNFVYCYILRNYNS